MDIIIKYFPNLTDEQKEKFLQLKDLYEYWNERINVISRKDVEMLYEHHVLHSLAIAKFYTFPPNSKILDVGTGGGFPGIPLAILFPESQFTLVDSIGKKITVVKEVSAALRLTNVTAVQQRAELLNEKYNYVVSRAVTEFPQFVKWVKNKFTGTELKPVRGIIYLKGGDLTIELKNFKNKVFINSLSEKFDESFFETKKIVYLPM